MRRTVATAIVLALALQHAACMTAPRPIASPRTFIPTKRPERVWMDQEGRRIEVISPQILGDTLFGRTRAGEEVWVPMDQTRFLARELDKTKTMAVVGGSLLAGLFVMSLIASSGEGFTPENVDRPHIGITLFRR